MAPSLTNGSLAPTYCRAPSTQPYVHLAEENGCSTNGHSYVDCDPIKLYQQSTVEDGVMPIAIVGMACRLPGGSSDPEKLWNMVASGRSGWSSIPAERFTQSSFEHPSSDVGGTFKSQGGHFLEENISVFDAPFFNISPLEARAMDPQMRLQLEVAYEALENGGVTLETISGTNTSVYIGVFSDDYSNMMLSDPETLPAHHVVGTGKAIFANRISYYFNLKGPSLALDTGCSASLVALHQACQSLRTGESKQAIVGGTNLILNPKTMISLSNLGFLSEEGRCFSFDSRGSGYGRGEGVASIFIKPLKDALANGDPIRAVIRNTFVNQDGKTPGLTMPSCGAQVSMMHAAYGQARIDPIHTGYVEAHGPGTKVGDPIEIEAISTALAKSRPSSNPLIVGSVKANIGHLESASGLASLIKAVLCLEKGLVPPSTNFMCENKELRLKERNLRVATELQPWPAGTVRRASVNSFGYGGTNAHVILDAHYSGHQSLDPNGYQSCHSPIINGTASNLELHELITHEYQSRNERVFLFSHRTKAGVLQLAENIRKYLWGKIETPNNQDFFDDLAHTMNSHRTAMDCRLAVTARDLETLADSLDLQKLQPRRAVLNPRIGFVFTGQGAQWFAMGRELISRYRVFRNSLLSADNHFKKLGASWSLMVELLKPAETSLLNSAAIGQPLCTALQCALVDLLASWNVNPISVTGHSSGEIAAAYACRSITFESALTMSYHRGYLASTMLEKGKLRGAMIAVGLSQAETELLISELPAGRGKAVIACLNSPRSVTVSGDRTAVISLQSKLEARHIFVRRLGVNTAYHSHHMDIIANSYLDALKGLPKPKPNKETLFFSSVTGKMMDGEELDEVYWVGNMVSQVRFSESLRNMCIGSMTNGAMVDERWARPAVDTLLEIGPHSGLAGFVKQIFASLKEERIRYTTCLIRNQDATITMLDAVKDLVETGCSVDLKTINFDQRERQPTVLVDLPPYPWDHSVSYWHESQLSLSYRKRSAPRHPLLGASTTDSSSLEPSWRNVIRTSEIPWIRGHVIQSNIVYPAAGYIAMAIEAALQRSRLKEPTVTPSNYKLRDINIGKMLLVPDNAEGVETMFTLRPFNRSSRKSSDLWDDFRVFSYSTNEGWNEHCRGLICVQYERQSSEVEGNRGHQLALSDFTEGIRAARSQCELVTDTAQLYERLNSIGLGFQDAFRCIEDVLVGSDQSLGTIRIPDTAPVMPKRFEHPHVIHPTTLDACMQVTSPALIRAGALNVPMVPTFIEELSISSNIPTAPGEKLLVHASTTVAGKRSCKFSLAASSPSAKLDQLPFIRISGFVCTAIPGGIGPTSRTEREPRRCHRVLWVPITGITCQDAEESAGSLGVDAALDPHVNGDMRTKDVPVSTNMRNGTKPSRPRIVLIEPEMPSTRSKMIISSLCSIFEDSIVLVFRGIEGLADARVDGKICICLAEVDVPILKTCNETQWLAVRKMLSSASSVLWVTRGMDTEQVETSLIVGLARSSRSDNAALRLVMLDLDGYSSLPQEASRLIAETLDKAFVQRVEGELSKDVEYAERGGHLVVPRLVEDTPLQQFLTSRATVAEPEDQSFCQTDRALCLEVGSPGLLDSLRFIDDPSSSQPIASDELRMRPKAFGVNFRDVMISLGQLEDRSLMSSEHSGIVTEVGADVSAEFHVGDRICAWGGKAYANTVKLKAMSAQKIPADMDFETAASIPIVYATVYYALVHLARLERGESVLIHSAAGGVGQAAIMLAKHLGAEIFVTVGNQEKKALLMERYDIPESHIFSSRQVTFVEGIRRLTGGTGVDVVLNSIAGESLYESFKCIAELGRFIELGKRDILVNSRLDMETFNRSVTFASVDLTVLFHRNPRLGKRIVREVFKLLQEGAILPVHPLNVFRFSEMETAFRLIQAGKHIGKVVLKVDDATTVKALPRAVAAATFAGDSSYLIIGGLGGLGRAMCRWMASRECKHIVVLSRSGLKNKNALILKEELESLGVKLIGYACDVGNLEQLEETLGRCTEEMPPFRGVIHSAMVIRDNLINNMTLESYHETLRPKVQGTLNLHKVFSNTPLDFFIMLSSCSGIIGGNGQANYASACTFQDAFARYRTSRGKPTRSLDLGMIEGAGYVSENLESLRFLTAQGFKPVKLDEFLSVLDYAITQPIRDVADCQLVVGLSDIDPEMPAAYFGDAKFSYLRTINKDVTAAGAGPSSIESSIKNASSLTEVQHIISSAIITQISKVLVVPIEDINPARPISAYGVDSLAAVELRNWFAKSLDATVGVMEILNGKSIDALAQEVIERSKLVIVETDVIDQSL